jgi:hypothetical protein
MTCSSTGPGPKSSVRMVASGPLIPHTFLVAGSRYLQVGGSLTGCLAPPRRLVAGIHPGYEWAGPGGPAHSVAYRLTSTSASDEASSGRPAGTRKVGELVEFCRSPGKASWGWPPAREGRLSSQSPRGSPAVHASWTTSFLSYRIWCRTPRGTTTMLQLCGTLMAPSSLSSKPGLWATSQGWPSGSTKTPAYPP